jgi:hypothetical protein
VDDSATIRDCTSHATCAALDLTVSNVVHSPTVNRQHLRRNPTDSGEARNTTALAMSSGSPMRPIIARAAKRSSVPGQSAAPRPRCVMSVLTKPGATAFTVMPCWPSSRAKRRVTMTYAFSSEVRAIL